MGRPTGLEPATPRFTILCSNQLSYDRRKEPAKFKGPPKAVNPFLFANPLRPFAVAPTPAWFSLWRPTCSGSDFSPLTSPTPGA